MAVYGISMAIYTSSYAILLDGSFNLISALLTISSMILVSKISKGYTKRYPLGYYMYETFIIFTKRILYRSNTNYDTFSTYNIRPYKVGQNTFKRLILQSSSDDYKKPLMDFITEN